jgi:hypothetical protein
VLNDLSAYSDKSATPEELAVQQGILAEYHFDVRIEPTWPKQDRSPVEVWWLVLAVHSGFFFKAFAEQTGKRSADGLSDLLARLAKSRRGEGRIEIGNPATSTVVVIVTSEPIPSLAELEATMDRSTPGQEIYYDQAEGRWRARS